MPTGAELIEVLSIWAVPVLLAITFHEAAHGFVAKRFQDGTAWALGRVTLNPIKHIDPVGTVALPLFLYVTSGFILGYAKPVPVNYNNLKPLKKGIICVALAGPLTNFVLGLVSVLLLHIVIHLPLYVAKPFALMLGASVTINTVLMVFNLMPLLPLDGGRVLQALLPPRIGYQFGRMEPYGMILILVLLVTGVLIDIIRPALYAVFNFYALLQPAGVDLF